MALPFCSVINMPTNNDKTTTIDCFPSDGVSRVAYRYGAFLKNEDNDSTNPFIEVLLIEIRMSDQWLFLDKCATFLVPFLDIDAVQIGSIWIGNALSDRTYKFNGKLITRKFNFDLSKIKAKNIKLTEKIPNSPEYYVPLKNYYLPTTDKVNYDIQGYPFTKYSNDSFKKVNHCLLVSKDGIQVFTSAIHILHSLFVNRKDIRSLLLSTSCRSIINRFLESYSTELINDQVEYKIKIRKPYEDIGDPAIIFLANLALNDHVQMIVDKLQRSLENIEYNDLKNNNTARYPIVYPPHPQNLFLEAEGIWLDDNKTRFFMTKIKSFDSIGEHIIDVNKDQLNNTLTNKDKNQIPKEKSKEKNEHINTQEPPSRVNGEYRKRSDIETGNTKAILKYSFNEPITEPTEIDSYSHTYNDQSEDVETSSDDPYGNEKTKTKKSESVDTPTRDGRFDLKYIIQALSELVTDDESLLINASSISAEGEKIAGYDLLQIKDIVKEPKHPSWIDYDRGRKLLFLQLEFTNQKNYAYLIDINKNKNHEAFCAFLFFTQNRLSSQQIKKICVELENAKGIKKWLVKCEYFIKVDSSISIRHMYATPEDWKNRFNSLFKVLSET